MKKLVYLAVALIVILIFVFSRSTDDTGEIAEVVDQMAEAGRNGMFGDVTEHVSIEYRDDYGATYLVVKSIVESFFQKFNKFDTKYKNLAVSFDESDEGDKTAVANLDIHITGYRSGVPVDILGREDLYQNITLNLKKNKLLGWKITKAEGLDDIVEEGM